MTQIKCDTSRHHTYGDYLEWSREYGDELIDGAAYVREPSSPSPLHQVVVFELGYQIQIALEGKPCRVFLAPFDIRLPKSTEADDQVDTVVQPDVFIVCDLKKIDARGMRGAPDWIAEVFSPGTGSHDRRVKLPVYERAGVREVWLIDPIKRALTLHRLEAGRYGPAIRLDLTGQTSLTAVPGVTVNWERVISKML
jgi:Uma2 family endonuclease